MRAMAQDTTKPEPAAAAKDQPVSSAKPRPWQVGEYGDLVVDKPGSTFAIVGADGAKAAAPTMTTQERLESLTPEERDLINNMARLDGISAEQFTVQQINGLIAGAEFIGDLPQD
jgi:hypothetical protein